MGNNVQISKRLFNALYQYHVCHVHGEASYIERELADKMKRHTSRILYGQHKTGASEDIRKASLDTYQELQKR